MEGEEFKQPDQEKYKEIKGLSIEDLEALEGDEKDYLEFLEKQLEWIEAMEPLLEIARSKSFKPEEAEKIFSGLNFMGRTAHEKFSSIGEDRMTVIHNGFIEMRGKGVPIVKKV